MAESKSDKIVHSAFREVAENEPRAVTRTRKKYGAKRAHKQEIAIALNKARAAGAHIPGANSPATVEQGLEGYERIDFDEV